MITQFVPIITVEIMSVFVYLYGFVYKPLMVAGRFAENLGLGKDNFMRAHRVVAMIGNGGRLGSAVFQI